MKALTTTIAFGVFLFGAGQDPAMERKAVARVQQTPASQYDAALPNQMFGAWFNQIVGPRAGVSWHLTECGEQPGGASDRNRDIPVCVEATAILASGRKVAAQILVGDFRQGLSEKTKFHFAVIEDGDQLHGVQKLADLAQMARMPFPRIRLRPVALPSARASRSFPPLYVPPLPPLILLPDLRLRDAGAEPPPPQPNQAGGLRISRGVSIGDAITKVTPAYPALAKQVNAYGEVQVEIEIDETGRVIEAKALTGHPMLRGAAEEAARKWVFKPTLLGGTPVKSKGSLTFLFVRPQ